MEISSRFCQWTTLRTDRYGTSIMTEWSRTINGQVYIFTVFMIGEHYSIEAWKRGTGPVHTFGNL